MKINIKLLIFLTFLGTSINSFAQFNSYLERNYEIEFMFNTFFGASEEYEDTQQFILSAKDNYELTYYMGAFEDVSGTMKKAFELADCEKCKEVSREKTDNPIKYIFEVIEYQDVFLVTKFKDEFKVIRYQPKEE